MTRSRWLGFDHGRVKRRPPMGRVSARMRSEELATFLLLATVLALGLSARGASAAPGTADFSLSQGVPYFANGYQPTDPGWLTFRQIFSAAIIHVAGASATANTSIPVAFTYEGKPASGSGYLTFTGAYDEGRGVLTGTYTYGYDIVYETTGFIGGRERQTGSYSGQVAVSIEEDAHQALLPFAGTFSVQHYTPAGSGWQAFGGPAQGSQTQPFWFNVSGSIPPQFGVGVSGVKGAGQVRISRNGGSTWTDATIGAAIDSDDMIDVENVPGTRLTLRWKDGSTLLVKPGTRVIMRSWGVTLQYGDVSANLKKQGKTFAIVTPTSNTGALGTELRAVSGPEGDQISVYAGSVEVSETAAGKAILEAGQRISVTTAGLGAIQSLAPFPDVSASPYSAAILGLYDDGIVSGRLTGGTWVFGPLEAVNRAQFAKMIGGQMELTVNEDLVPPFGDLGADDPTDLYPHEYIAAAAAAGITAGKKPDSYAPWDPISRAQVVTMLVRALQNLRPGALNPPPTDYAGSLASFSDVHGQAMRTAEYNGLLTGLQGFAPGWDPWRSATRGEVAQMLWNAGWR